MIRIQVLKHLPGAKGMPMEERLREKCSYVRIIEGKEVGRDGPIE